MEKNKIDKNLLEYITKNKNAPFEWDKYIDLNDVNQKDVIKNFFCEQFILANSRGLTVLLNLFKSYILFDKTNNAEQIFNRDLVKIILKDNIKLEIKNFIEKKKKKEEIVVASHTIPNENTKEIVVTYLKPVENNRKSVFISSVKKIPKQIARFFTPNNKEIKSNKDTNNEKDNKGNKENQDNKLRVRGLTSYEAKKEERRVNIIVVKKQNDVSNEEQITNFSPINLEFNMTKEEIKVDYNALKQIGTKISPEFIDEDEKEGYNIEYHYFDSKKDIYYLSFNLFLKKIAIGEFSKTNNNLFKGFIQQYHSFISPAILIKKINSAYSYYWKKKKVKIIELILFLNEIVLKFYDFIRGEKEIYEQIKVLYSEIVNTDWVKNSKNNIEIKQIATLFAENKESFEAKFIRSSQKVNIKNNNDSIKLGNRIKMSKKNYFYLTDFSEEDIAKQLTYISFNLMSNIDENEIISAKFQKNNKEINSPNITKLKNRFDLLIFFIIEDIMSYDRKQTRAQMIYIWIKIALKCKEMNNFNDCFNINIVFFNYILQKLPSTWKKLSKQALADLAQLKEFCSYANNYGKIKAAINICREKNESYVPYLGILLKDIANNEEKMNYIKDDKLINFLKIKKVNEIIKNFFQFNSTPYNIRPRDELKIFEHLNPKSAKELEEDVAKIEPDFTIRKKRFFGKRETQTDKYYYESLRKSTLNNGVILNKVE